jgi:aromatic-L-amino-acid decarboxylase
MSDDPPRHFTPDEFRKAGYATVDWVARYLERLEDLPVSSTVTPGEIRAKLPERAPETGDPLESILRDLDDIVVPGLTNWQSPSFFGYFPGNASPPAMLGDLVSSGLGVQGMLWATSPACTELETHVLDWLVDMLALPDRFRSSSPGGGVIQDTASSATLCAVLAGRERATSYRSNDAGVTGPLTVYASSQVHSSLDKAVAIAGIGREHLRKIDVDESFGMRPDALARAIAEDLDAGMTPAMVCATVGTTSSTAIDPVRPIGEICNRDGVWLHVDAAYAGSAAVCPEFRWIHDGLELADSYCFNPHKWLLTNFDCDAFYVADRAALIRTLSVLPEYLRNRATESGAVWDYRDWHIPLGRRFRALKLWFVIRHYGVEGLRQHVRCHVSLAQDIAARVERHPDLEVAAPVPLGLACFRHRAGDEATQRLLDQVNGSGNLLLTHTKLDDRLVARMAIGGTYTEPRHVDAAWALIDLVAQAVADDAA